MESEHTRKGEDEGGECTWYAVKSRAEQQRQAGRQREGGAAAATAGEGEEDAFVKCVRRGKGRQATSGT